MTQARAHLASAEAENLPALPILPAGWGISIDPSVKIPPLATYLLPPDLVTHPPVNSPQKTYSFGFKTQHIHGTNSEESYFIVRMPFAFRGRFSWSSFGGAVPQLKQALARIQSQMEEQVRRAAHQSAPQARPRHKWHKS